MTSVSLFPILAAALLVGVVAGVVVLLKGRRRGREGTDAACGRCGYNLTGSESNRCPECGTLFIEAGVTLGNPSPMKARWVLVSLVVLSSLFVAGLGLSVSHRAARRAQAQAKAQLLQMRAIETQAAATEAQQHNSLRRAETNDNGEP